MNCLKTFLAGLLFAVASQPAIAEPARRVIETKKGPVMLETWEAGFDQPWGIEMLPDGRMLVTEKNGAMFVWDSKAVDGKLPVANVPAIRAFGQGGLLDVALDPGFSDNGMIYFTFADMGRNRRAGTAIASARLVLGESPRLEAVRTLFSMERKRSSGRHFGSRIVMAPDGKLFFTIGDQGDRPRAQKPFDAAGKVMRINPDGSIPADNPFADGKRALPQIWSTGHRNPQGATLDASGRLWTIEHGAAGGDEINIPERGKNYGWPVISYGRHYSGGKIGLGTSAPGYEQPVYYWDPSIAPGGMDFYRGDKIPFWQGDLFAGALKFALLSRLEIENGKIVGEEQLLEGIGRVREVRSFADGALWLLTDGGDVHRLTGIR